MRPLGKIPVFLVGNTGLVAVMVIHRGAILWWNRDLKGRQSVRPIT
jgi:hypothetical protein